MGLPNFLCIGAQKAGTSWLFINLIQHPSIWMPPIKELHYFDHLFVPPNRKWTSTHIRLGAGNALKWHIDKSEYVDFSYVRYICETVLNNPFTESWYRSLFDRPAANNKLTGDITPEYSTIPEAGIRYIRSLLGAPKLIYIIRHPVDRAMSQLRMNIERTNRIPSNDAEWVAVAQNPDIVDRGDYRTYIPRWKAYFCDDDLLFIPWAQLIKEPEKLMADVEDFLRISRFTGYSNLKEAVHPTRPTSIPPSVRSYFERNLEPQVEFLRNEFGVDFV